MGRHPPRWAGRRRTVVVARPVSLHADSRVVVSYAAFRRHFADLGRSEGTVTHAGDRLQDQGLRVCAGNLRMAPAVAPLFWFRARLGVREPGPWAQRGRRKKGEAGP